MTRARGQRRQIADREIESARAQRIFDGFDRQRLDTQFHARRLLVQGLTNRRQVRQLAGIGERQPERARAHRRIEVLRVTQRFTHRIQRPRDDARQLERDRRGLHAGARANEQRIVEQGPQTP